MNLPTNQDTKPVNILLAEDDAIIASGLTYALRSEGWAVTHCADTPSALAAVKEQVFTLALLDLSLPGGDGYDIFYAIKRGGDIPVIFVTAADDEGNTVKALETGADDYIAKPFRVRELLARIKSVLRRSGGGGVLPLGGLSIDTAKAKVIKDGAEVPLTAMEYRLLLCFAQNKGITLGRTQILENLWDIAGDFVNDNTLSVYIKRLREKLEEDPANPRIIQTVRGLGYRAGDF